MTKKNTRTHTHTDNRPQIKRPRKKREEEAEEETKIWNNPKKQWTKMFIRIMMIKNSWKIFQCVQFSIVVCQNYAHRIKSQWLSIFRFKEVNKPWMRYQSKAFTWTWWYCDMRYDVFVLYQCQMRNVWIEYQCYPALR